MLIVSQLSDCVKYFRKMVFQLSLNVMNGYMVIMQIAYK